MKKSFKVIIWILLFILSIYLGWILGEKFANKEDKLTNKETKEEVKELNKDYQNWINYIINQNITSITYYKPILDEEDINFKEGVPSYYIVDLTKEDLISIFDSMRESTIGLDIGLGGPVEFIKIVYDKDGKDVFINITAGATIFAFNDSEYENILRNEVKDIFNSMSEDEKTMYEENPVGNIIKNWDGLTIRNYYNQSKARTYYGQ